MRMLDDVTVVWTEHLGQLIAGRESCMSLRELCEQR